MGNEGYQFTSHADRDELERLQIQEQAIDWLSIGRLTSLGLGPSARCLEAGLGAGSMTRWMARATRPDGHVLAIDLDNRFFALCQGDGIELKQANLLTVPLEPDSFDFIHCRLVLMHLSPEERLQLLGRMLAALRPGGWLVAMDSAFDVRPIEATTRGQELAYLVFETIRAASMPHADYAHGLRLPPLLSSCGYVDVDGTGVFGLPITPGANRLSMVIGAESVHRVGLVPQAETEDLVAAATAGNVLAGIPYAMAWGRRPAA